MIPQWYHSGIGSRTPFEAPSCVEFARDLGTAEKQIQHTDPRFVVAISLLRRVHQLDVAVLAVRELAHCKEVSNAHLAIAGALLASLLSMS
jgi:hypothetical protein